MGVTPKIKPVVPVRKKAATQAKTTANKPTYKQLEEMYFEMKKNTEDMLVRLKEAHDRLRATELELSQFYAMAETKAGDVNQRPPTMEEAYNQIMDLIKGMPSREVPFLIWRIVSDVKTLLENSRREAHKYALEVSSEAIKQDQIYTALSKVLTGEADFLNLNS